MHHTRMKNKFLVTCVLILLMSVGAWAQAIYEARANAVSARAGGGAEKAGDVVLFLTTAGQHSQGMVTLTYSAPLAKATQPMASAGTVQPITDADRAAGTFRVELPPSGSALVTISDVRLDLRSATAPVTVSLSGDANAFVSGVQHNVVSSISQAVMIGGPTTPTSILTRGQANETVTLTLGEAFASAFTPTNMTNASVSVEVAGVPSGAGLSVAHTPAAAGATPPTSSFGNEVTLSSGTLPSAMIIDSNGDVDATVSLDMTAGNTPLVFIISFDDTGSVTSSVNTLSLDFTLATQGRQNLSLPIPEGSITVRATMAPTTEPMTPSPGHEYFAATFTDPETLFTFEPASCTLLYPFVYSGPGFPGKPDWNTAIAVTNPSAGVNAPLDGLLTFMLYPNEGGMTMYETGPSTPGAGGPGSALDGQGMLSAGKTYTV